LVLVGDALAVVGSRREALEKMRSAIALYESALKGGPNINVERELAITKQKRGGIQLMNGDFAGAVSSIRDARTMLAPMAKADPQNSMLRLDMVGQDYEEGRILASTGKYAAAILLLQRAIKGFQDLHAHNELPDDALATALGSAYIWLGEAKAGERNLHEALQNYRKASTALQSPPGELVADDTLCELATAYTKTGDVLTRTGDLHEAAAVYRKALDIVAPLVAAPERQDVPALYADADAFAGMGDVATTRARTERHSRVRRQLWIEAQAWYGKSLSTLQKIPNPSSLGPGFRVRDPHEIAVRLADKSAIR
jgi:tetratricopeptide (TPR) repeat protein